MARVHGAEMKRRSSHELSGLGCGRVFFCGPPPASFQKWQRRCSRVPVTWHSGPRAAIMFALVKFIAQRTVTTVATGTVLQIQ